MFVSIVFYVIVALIAVSTVQMFGEVYIKQSHIEMLQKKIHKNYKRSLF